MTQSVPIPAELGHLRPSNARGATILAVAIGGTATGVWLSAQAAPLAWIAGQALLAAAFVQWFAVLHECGHDTLLCNRRCNGLIGRIASLLTLIPFHCWTRIHGRHHKWTGWQDLDPTTESLVPRQLGRTERLLVNICWRLWIPLFSILYRLNNFWNLPRLFALFPRGSDRRAIVRDTALVLAFYVALVAALGPAAVLRIALLARIAAFMVEDLLLLSQHTHVPQHNSHGTSVRPYPAVEQEPFTRSLRLPAWVSALLLHVDAHELHHMYPFVPGYHLHRIPYSPQNEIGWWRWMTRAKRLRGEVLLFQNRLESGWDI